jgi:hypothetical protein
MLLISGVDKVFDSAVRVEAPDGPHRKTPRCPAAALFVKGTAMLSMNRRIMSRWGDCDGPADAYCLDLPLDLPGMVTAHRTTDNQFWIITADDAEIQRLREVRNRPPGYYTRKRWTDAQTRTTSQEGPRP